MAARMLMVGLVSLAVLVAGCGESAKEKAAKVQHKQALVAQAEHRQAVAKAAREYQTCQARIGSFMKALSDLKGHQEIGLTESDFASRLGDVQAASHELPKAGELSLSCDEALLPAEHANLYEIEVSEYWGKCVESLSCDEATKKRIIQSKWSKSSAALEQSETKLAAIKTPE